MNRLHFAAAFHAHRPQRMLRPLGFPQSMHLRGAFIIGTYSSAGNSLGGTCTSFLASLSNSPNPLGFPSSMQYSRSSCAVPWHASVCSPYKGKIILRSNSGPTINVAHRPNRGVRERPKDAAEALFVNDVSVRGVPTDCMPNGHISTRSSVIDKKRWPLLPE